MMLPPKFGAIAQLGERNTGSVEVSGSIPLSSTIFTFKNSRLGGCFLFLLLKTPPSIFCATLVQRLRGGFR